jgi:hypothetical protein
LCFESGSLQYLAYLNRDTRHCRATSYLTVSRKRLERGDDVEAGNISRKDAKAAKETIVYFALRPLDKLREKSTVSGAAIGALCKLTYAPLDFMIASSGRRYEIRGAAFIRGHFLVG